MQSQSRQDDLPGTNPPALAPEALPGERALTARQRRQLDGHRDTARALWRLQEQLRDDVRRYHGLRATAGLRLTAKRALRIVALLEDGNTRDDLARALKNRAAASRRDRGQLRWFNGDANWSARSVTFALGAEQHGDTPANPSTREMRELAAYLESQGD